MSFDISNLFWCMMGVIGSTAASLVISWFFSGRHEMVADIITRPSKESKFSSNMIIGEEDGFVFYDTYVLLKNKGNQALTMADFAPLNMPHIAIVNGRLQKREKPYYVLPNPDAFAMYNNVELSDDGKSTINITFDQLKKGQSIEIVVHSLIAENSKSRIKLGVAATLRNGNFIYKKQLWARYGMVQIIISAIVLIAVSSVPTVSASVKKWMMVALAAWWPLSVLLLDIISYWHIRGKIIK